MSERPIIFSGLMVKAILEGRKTQTRRVIKKQPPKNHHPQQVRNLYTKELMWCNIGDDLASRTQNHAVHDGNTFPCPYGIPGDRLFVKEGYVITTVYDRCQNVSGHYLADVEPFRCDLTDHEWELWSRRKRPWAATSGRFMYKSLARLILEVKAVRVERVQHIGIYDIRDEGLDVEGFIAGWEVEHGNPAPGDDCVQFYDAARDDFRILWDSINGKRGYGWAENPWVFVVEFEVAK